MTDRSLVPLQPVFRLVDSDSKTTSKLLKHHDDELNRSLRSAVPGLVTLSSDAHSSAADRNGPSSSFDDRSSSGPTSHRLLVSPDAFNVSILFQPTLSFLKRAAAIMPVGIEDESSGLDEFVVKVYLPQLEEKVSELVQTALGGNFKPRPSLARVSRSLTSAYLSVLASGAFEEDTTWRMVAERPVVKSGTQVLAVIESLCSMLRTTPFHRENYSRLIISVIIQFYQRCSGNFRGRSRLRYLLLNKEALTLPDRPRTGRHCRSRGAALAVGTVGAADRACRVHGGATQDARKSY